MLLNEEFLEIWEELNALNEAKADTEKLINFAGEELANRFLVVKNRFKSPENDLYYWIKNKTVDELEKAVSNVENVKSATKVKKDIADRGAELVYESDHWKVYSITTFEASQNYGRDTKWCITGINNYGTMYWDEYTNSGIKFYFLITKDNYDPRGTHSKIAIAVYPGDNIAEVFNQQDDTISLNEIPYFNEIKYPPFKEFVEARDTHSWRASVDNTNKTFLGRRIDWDDTLEDILKFISQLTQEEKDNLYLRWMYDDENLAIEVYSPLEGDYVGPGMDDRIIFNWDWEDLQHEIARALNVPD